MDNFKIVYFNPNGDGVTSLYKNGELIKYGDYYHDKIDETLLGYFRALIDYSIPHTLTKYNCSDGELNRDICEYADEPPQKFEEIKGLNLR